MSRQKMRELSEEEIPGNLKAAKRRIEQRYGISFNRVVVGKIPANVKVEWYYPVLYYLLGRRAFTLKISTEFMGIVDSFSVEELEAVLAHEVGHIMSKTGVPALLPAFAVLSLLYVTLCFMLYEHAIWQGLLMMAGIYFMVIYLTSLASIYDEYKADSFVPQELKPIMVNALLKCHYSLDRRPPTSYLGIARVLLMPRTHPSIEARIKNLGVKVEWRVHR